MLESITIYTILTQSLGFIGMGLNFLMRAMTNDLHLKIVGIVAAAVWTVHYAMLGAWVGASNNLIELTQITSSLWVLPPLVQWVFILMPVLPGPWIVHGWVDTLPILATVTLGFSMMFLQGIPLRFALVAQSILWLFYNVVNVSLGGVAVEVISLLILAVTIWGMKSPSRVDAGVANVTDTVPTRDERK
jgi:inner membrane protein